MHSSHHLHSNSSNTEFTSIYVKHLSPTVMIVCDLQALYSNYFMFSIAYTTFCSVGFFCDRY